MTVLDNNPTPFVETIYAPKVQFVWRGRHALRLTLLVVIASGMTYSTLPMPGLLSYLMISGTLALIFIGLTVLRYLNHATPIRQLLVFIPTLIILYHVGIHGILLGRLRDWEFLKAVINFSIYMVFIIAGSVVWLQWQHLRVLNAITCFWAYLMGGIGIIHFVIANALGRPWYMLPESLRNGSDFAQRELDQVRFGSLIRSAGIALEPSYYGSGMAVLMGLSLACIMLVPDTGWKRWYQWGALLSALLGVIVSVSGAAWILALAVILAWVLPLIQWRGLLPRLRTNLSRYHQRATRFIIVFLTVTTIAVAIFLYPFMERRTQAIMNGRDTSANSRVAMSLSLIVQPADTFTESLLGTGVGRQKTSARLWRGYAETGMLEPVKASGRSPIWNGYTYFTVTGGYIGLGLILWLVFIISRARNHTGVPLHFLTVLVVLYPTAHGMILFSEWYALLILLFIIKDIRKPTIQ